MQAAARRSLQNRHWLPAVVMVAVGVAGPMWNGTAEGATFQGLGLLPIDGSPPLGYSHVTDISADGSVIVGHAGPWFESVPHYSFIWTADDGMLGLDASDLRLDVSADGHTVTGIDRAGRLIRWDTRGHPTAALLPGGVTEVLNIDDVTSDGAVVYGTWTRELDVGGQPATTYAERFRWSEVDGFSVINHLPRGEHSFHTSDDESRFVLDRREFIYTWDENPGVGEPNLEEVSELSSPRPTEFVVTGASADTATLFGYQKLSVTEEQLGKIWLSTEAFLWSERTGLTMLGDLPGGIQQSATRAITPDGRVAVGNSNNADRRHPGREFSEPLPEAFIWTATAGMQPLAELFTDAGLTEALAGWTLFSANAISDDGLTIAGHGINPDGQEEAWVAKLDAITFIAGDYNANGQVEQGDLDLVLQNWGQNAAGNVPAGWTNDPPVGVIDQGELDGVLQNWGITSGPSFAGHTVPEPTAALGVLCVAGVVRLRRL